MKKWIEELFRKVLGEVLGAEALSKALMRVAEVVLAEHPEWVKAIAAKAKAIAEEQPADAGGTPAPPGGGEPELSWCYGGFDGSKAEVAEDAVLAGARLEGDTLAFSWALGGCEQLGATSKSDADHTVACLFLEDGAGGKFEWVSTSRTTRSVENVLEGYNGWPRTALDGGGKLWFCICGADGKRRTACVEVAR